MKHEVKRLVFIEWVDSVGHAGWTHEFKKNEDYKLSCESVGWVTKETKKSLTIANSRSALGMVADRTSIPKVAIKKIWEIV